MNNKINMYYVDFTTAKLLKEKGFNEPCIAFYDEENNSQKINYYCNANHNVTGGINCWHNDLLSVTNSELDKLGAFCYKNEKETEVYERITAPNYFDAIEWLRINHGIWIEVNYVDSVLEFICMVTTIKINRIELEAYNFSNPQEAYSRAFNYILNNLI